MLGSVRFVLASLVLVNHLWAGADNRLGFHAVVAFYLISGFLMTKVIHEVYGTRTPDVGRFLLNRFLRVYPAYWLFLAATLLVVRALPLEARFLGPRDWPATSMDWFANVTLIDLTWATEILVPPAWSLGVEVLFYIAMPLLLARSRRAVDIWFAVSLGLTALLIGFGAPFGYRYYPAYAASLFFSGGAWLYFHRDALSALILPQGATLLLLAVFALLPVAVEMIGLSHLTFGYYGAALLMMPILLSAANGSSAGPLDRWLGDLAFPMFLSHFVVASLVTAATLGLVESRSLLFVALAFVATLLVSLAFVVLVDRPIQYLRSRVRGGPPIRRTVELRVGAA